MSNMQTSDISTPETLAEKNERAFICHTIYTRAGKSLAASFTEAKAMGAKEQWFSDPTCRVIWRGVEALFKTPDWKSVNLLTIVKAANRAAAESRDVEEQAVRVSSEWFESIAKYITPGEDKSAYARELSNGAIARQAKQDMAKAVADIAAGEDATAVISRLISASQNNLEGKDPCHKVSISDLCDQALEQWELAHKQVSDEGNYEWCPGLPLPWRKLSYTLNGFTPDLTILAARPGVGKTSLALNFTRYWLDQGLKVVFVSVDMSPIGFVKRQISERARISSRKLQFGKSTTFDTDMASVRAAVQQLKDLERNESFTLYSEYDVDAIKASCNILKDQGKIDVLIVDYLQLLKFHGSEKLSANQKTTYISNTLHEIANTLQIPVLCLSQLNRDNTKEGGREPQLSDLRDSGAIEQDAANVLLLCRNDKLYEKWKENPPVQFAKNPQYLDSLRSYRPIWVIVAKAREGDEGTKLPFVVVQNKYSWYLGDYEAEGDEQFARVYDDWRHDPIEQAWEQNGALIKMADVRAMEIANLNRDRISQGLTPIPLPGEQETLGLPAGSRREEETKTGEDDYPF